MVEARRWPARALALSADSRRQIEGHVCAAIWPTRALDAQIHWFDELSLWTEGFQPSTTQRGRMQCGALDMAFELLESEQIGQIGVTLSFGTAERFPENIADAFERHALVTHRIAVVLRGAFARLRSRSRVRALCAHLRAQHALVGYWLTAPSISLELKALEFLQPDFTKLRAPASLRLDLWQDLLFEARVAGVPADRMIVAGLDTEEGVTVARQIGVPFGQGQALRPPYAPPALWSLKPTFAPGVTATAR